MSLRARVAALLLAAAALGTTACSKKQDAAPAGPAPVGAAPTTAGAAGAAPSADGVRRVPIDVVEAGYSPDRITGKPGEKLNLVFTRKVDGHCYEELKPPGGPVVALPKGKPVEIPVTVPQDGEVKFACGMGMLEGVIVADKAKS